MIDVKELRHILNLASKYPLAVRIAGALYLCDYSTTKDVQSLLDQQEFSLIPYPLKLAIMNATADFKSGFMQMDTTLQSVCRPIADSILDGHFNRA